MCVDMGFPVQSVDREGGRASWETVSSLGDISDNVHSSLGGGGQTGVALGRTNNGLDKGLRRCPG